MILFNIIQWFFINCIYNYRIIRRISYEFYDFEDSILITLSDYPLVKWLILHHSQIDLVTRVDMYVWQVCFRGPPSHVRREKDLKATDEEIRDQSRIPKCEEWWKPHVGRTREKERRQSLHLAISLPSLDPWPQCTRSRDHVLFLVANGTDRRDPRAHADEWTARYIIKRPSDPLSEEEKRSRIFVEKKKRPRQKTIV